ncbi:MAG: hypothetical protein ACP5D1_07455 [Bacteroidales bacterium]
MIINNSRNVISIKLRQLIVTIFFIALFALLYASSLIPAPLMGLSRNEIGIGLLVIYVLFIMYHFGLDLNYIIYNDEGPKIILRYYSIKIYSQKHHSIEIPKKDFQKYEIRRTFFWLKPQIILYLNMKKGTGRFPPVSLAALSGKQRKALIESLDRYVK